MRPARSTRILAISSLALALAGDRAAATATCANAVNNPPPAACAASSMALTESILNPPVGEDLSFFSNTTAVPTVVFLLDTSANMRSLPIDVTSAGVRAAGTGCGNTILNRLKYKTNPCRDAMGRLIPSANMTAAAQAACPTGGTRPGIPPGWNMVYSATNTYVPFESANGAGLNPNYTSATNLFVPNMYYGLDWGWSQNTTDVQPAYETATASAICNMADPAFAAQCAACLDGSASATNPNQGGGYWLHPTNPRLVVFKGNWLNFYPPKYVLARRILLDQIAAMDGAGTSRQALVILGTDIDQSGGGPKFGCYGPTDNPANPSYYDTTKNGSGSAYDVAHDGARFLDTNSGLWPPCSSSSCSPAQQNRNTQFYSSIESANWLFSSPTGTAIGDDLSPGVSGAITGCPSVPGVRWTTRPDGVCRGTYDATVTGPGAIPSPFPASLNGKAAVCAPYGEALFDVGQYFSTGGYFSTLFPSTPSGLWLKDPTSPKVFNFDEGTGNNASVCPPGSCSCPQPAVIMITGGSPQFDDNLPASLTGAPACGLSDSSSNVVKVAQYLATTNLRTEGFPKPVNAQTFVVDVGGSAPTLAAAARAGKGAYLSAMDAKELRSALNEALQFIRTKPVSFSNTAVSAVQAVTAQGVLVPRFTPKPGALWEGHLYKYKLFSEAACGCPTTPGCDLNADGICDGVYYVDADGGVIVETAAGDFQKANLVGTTFVANGTPAKPIWDAGARLSSRGADTRKIMTVLDSNGDNLIDSRDQVIEFKRSNACLLAPYLNIAGSDLCNMLNSEYNACLSIDECAGILIDFVRGKDVLNNLCTAGFDRTNPPDRPNKLGDIFHSTPVPVDPPLRGGSIVGQGGLVNQYLVSIEGTEVKQATDAASGLPAYAAYAQANAHRDKLVLVGANDGLLHAFHNGTWRAADNPATAINECPNPPTNCVGYYDDGTGDELWAFIPLDLLPKLQNLMLSSHQYYVDGSAMVRDVWADSATPAFTKTLDEFHTVAVVGERRGGNAFFALDVTNPQGPATFPSTGFFRWMYPQPTSPDVGNFAATYADFLPTPPPVGPVRLANAGSPYVYQGTSYEERWIALLNGGYDSTMQGRGNGLVMVDVWRGGNGSDSSKPLWSVWGGTGGTITTTANTAAGTTTATASGNMMFSFAATPGMTAFGPSTMAPANQSIANGGFFDTATIGDVGGQIWTARFNDANPANWVVAQAFAVSDAGTSGTTVNVCARQPFFHITANVVSSKDSNQLRMAVGSGDRFNIRDTTGGGTCSPTNLLACVRRGCSFNVQLERESCGGEVEKSRGITAGANASTCSMTPGQTEGGAFNLLGCCNTAMEIEQELNLSCPGVPAMEWEPEIQCSKTSAFNWCGDSITPFTCSYKKDVPFDFSSILPSSFSGPLPTPPPRNAFYSMRVFDKDVTARGIFNTGAQAATYGAAHLTSAGLTQINSYVTPPAPTAASAGWRVDYGLPNPPGHALGAGYDSINERTATLATVVSGCAVWTTMTPSANVSQCASLPAAMSSVYQLDLVTGNQCYDRGTNAYLAAVQDTSSTVPPAPPQLEVFVTPSGQVPINLISLPRAGGAPTSRSMDTNNEALRQVQTLEVSRLVHACRHARTQAEAAVFCPTQ